MARPRNEDEDEKMKNFISRDKKDFPDCNYSVSSQKECTSINGNFACETIRRIFRNCPGVRPEQVYDITTTDSGTVPKPPGGGDGGIPIMGGRTRGGMIAPPDEWPTDVKHLDDLLGSIQEKLNGLLKGNPFFQPDADIDQGGSGGGGTVRDRYAEPAWKSTTPRVPPPHKGQGAQSQPSADEEATKDSSVVARA